MTINLIDARRGLHDKCLELFADKNIAEQIYRYLCDGIEECEEAEPIKHGWWTPISTAEPPGGIHVLVTIQWEDDDLEVTELDYGFLKATRWPHLDKVIAWAPLPEPYKEASHEH